MNTVGGARNKESTRNLSDFWIGATHQFLPDGKTPALLGFAELAVAENYGFPDANSISYEWEYGKSFLFGITTYRAIDPLVLSFSTGYRLNLERTNSNGTTVDPGDVWYLEPIIHFAVNNDVSLRGCPEKC